KICKAMLLTSVIFNLGMLAFFKYTDFFIGAINSVSGSAIPLLNLTLPLGISFYTFQTMSYTIDVYWDKVKAEKNIIDFGAFVVLFPQLIAGPIVRFTDINRELKERTVDLGQIESGVKTFIMGMASKVLIANNIGLLWAEAQSTGFGNLSSPMAWLAVWAFAFQLYFDFSGYSLMAIGLGRMLGFSFPQNFNYPFVSRSLTEFWRRWHMTLGSWFREYVYFPLGGSRKGTKRTVFNLFLVWTATGFWHGAQWNYLFWGFFLFFVMIIEKYFILGFLENHPKLSLVYIIIVLQFNWMIFGVNDLGGLWQLIIRTFSFTWGVDWIYALRNYGIVFILAAFFSVPLIKPYFEKFEAKHRWGSLAVYTLLAVISVAYLVDSTYNPFLYFRF
ncbi:MAG: MBOAT family O-acyltransferase, partial [Oscillospiraceae bacterium]